MPKEKKPEFDFSLLSDKALVGIVDGLCDYFHTTCVQSDDMPLNDFYSLAGAAQELYKRKKAYISEHTPF